jgi:hypothetical protein
MIDRSNEIVNRLNEARTGDEATGKTWRERKTWKDGTGLAVTMEDRWQEANEGLL